MVAPVPLSPLSTTIARLDTDRVHYRRETLRLRAAAEADNALYDLLHRHDDQFDLSDALNLVVLSLATVADRSLLLATARIAGIAGITMDVAGFASLSIHPAALAALLS